MDKYDQLYRKLLAAAVENGEHPADAAPAIRKYIRARRVFDRFKVRR